MNARADKPAELIARYLDSILRRGSKAAAQEGSLEDVLDAALALFRYVQVGPASLPLHRVALRLSCDVPAIGLYDSSVDRVACATATAARTTYSFDTGVVRPSGNAGQGRV